MCNELKFPKIVLTIILFWAAFFLAGPPATSQPSPIVLLNPSFEDEPWHSKPPRGWYFCGQAGETPPDVHPTGYFEVGQPPAHGDTYIGMVVRDNETWEAVGQRLQQPLQAGRCYRFSLQACRSPNYRSVSRLTGKRVFYNDPVRLRLWGGEINCDHAELLAASDVITDTTWTTLHFDIQPERNHHYFVIEAFYPEDTASLYLGNILVDDCSPLIPVDCRDRTPLTEAAPVEVPEVDTPAEFASQIRELATGIRFGYGTAELVNQYFRSLKGEILQENLSLYKLTYYLHRFPELELEVAVRGPGKLVQVERMERIAQHLLAWGIPRHRFRIHPYRKRDGKTEWLGVNGPEDLFIRLR
jgi:hypothetical protein